MQCLEEEEEEEEEEEGKATAAVAAHLPPPTPPLLQLRCAHVGRASTQPSRAPGLSACCLLFDCVNCKLKSSKACGCRRRPVDSAYDAPADSAYDAPAHATRHSSALKLVRDASIFNAVADLRCSRICFCKLRQQCSQLLAGLPLLHILLLSVSSIPNSAQPPPLSLFSISAYRGPAHVESVAREEGLNVLVGIEEHQVRHLLADPDELDGDTQLVDN